MAKSWLFDLVHYPHDPAPAAYDPRKAVEVFDDHLKVWEQADRLGFEGLWLGEHHFTAYNMTPSPNVMLAAVSQRTKRMRLGIMVNVLPFHQPLRLAEEIAMLDLLTHGRLECGLGRGVDEQEFLRLKMPYEEARPRFEEGLELMIKAWTQSNFQHDGTFFHVGEATIYPRPLQQPHPRLWITALSPKTIDWAATRGYPMSSVFLPVDRTKAAFNNYRAAAERAGRKVTSDDLVLARNVIVADSMKQAREIAQPALNHVFGLFLEAAVPKDLTTLPKEYEYYKEFFRPFAGMDLSFDDLCRLGLVVVGDPSSVRDQLVAQARETGLGHLMAWMHFGNVATADVMRSQELYAREVLPALAGIP